MTTRTEAKDQIIGGFRTAWLADAATLSIPLHFRNVRSDVDAEADATTKLAPPYFEVIVGHLVGQVETQGEIGLRRFLNTVGFTGNLYTAPGDGDALSDVVGGVAVRILRQLRNPSGVWHLNDAVASELGIAPNGLALTSVTGTFAYQEAA